MKAAHRKELQTNVLADRMGKLYESVKAGPKRGSLLVWVLVLLVLVVIVGWRYYSSVSHTDASARWLELREATNDPLGIADNLQTFADKEKGTVQARIARYQLARISLREGQENFASEKRGKALTSLRTARDLYEQLARETTGQPTLYQEALMGSAKTEEALALVPGEDGGTPQGSLDRAKDYYLKVVQYGLKQLGQNVPAERAVETMQNLVREQIKELGQEAEPDKELEVYQRLADYTPEKFKLNAQKWRDMTYLARSAAARVKDLQQQEQVVAFYNELNKLASPKISLPEPKKP
jgi:hypothetical protein